jgi:hypothetical protein
MCVCVYVCVYVCVWRRRQKDRQVPLPLLQSKKEERAGLGTQGDKTKKKLRKIILPASLGAWTWKK